MSVQSKPATTPLSLNLMKFCEQIFPYCIIFCFTANRAIPPQLTMNKPWYCIAIWPYVIGRHPSAVFLISYHQLYQHGRRADV